LPGNISPPKNEKGDSLISPAFVSAGHAFGISRNATQFNGRINVMLTRREFILVLITGIAASGVAAVAQNAKKPPMTSTAIEWNSVAPVASATGSGRKFLNGPTPTLDNLDCHASTLNPGASNHDILRRPDDEVIIIKEGTIEAYVNDKWIRLGPGSVIFNAANVPQSMRNVGDGPATYHVVTFRPAAAAATSPATKP
jgi:mannose-6-phosphate isomerase-like protein (cupin superfamily)